MVMDRYILSIVEKVDYLKAKSRLEGGSCALQHLTPSGGGMLQHVGHNYYSCAPPPLFMGWQFCEPVSQAEGSIA
jgi:hypothetical protein